MNTLDHSVLMYDEYCPLCQWYTQLFVDLKFIQENERMSYQRCSKFKDLPVDFDLARNKIAYYHHGKTTTFYGVDALIEVLSKRQAGLMRIAKFQPIYWLITKLYNFISYNRKIIAPSMMCSGDNCIPDKSWTYRFLFILFSSVLVISVVGPFFMLAYPGLIRWDTPHIDAVIFPLQFLVQGSVLLALGKKDFYEYFGHLAFVSLMGALILWGMYGFFTLMAPYGLNVAALAPTGFGLTLGIMFMIHKRRMAVTGLPKILTWTWLAFRLIAAFVVFKFI
jgi:predicted DCC family thiol-disulfide oxidoreductase YuxK